MDRYERLAKAFVGLADTLVADYDVVELAQQLIDSAMELLPIDAAGIVLADDKGGLHVFATSSQQTRMLELLQLHADAGPCLDAYRTGEPVLVEDLHAEAARWPAFVERADEYDLRAVTALPLRLRTERVGALNLFAAEAGPMAAADVSVGQALADVAAIGILQQRALSQSEATNQQLQTALTTRLIIEQAKGVLAERGKIDMDRAFHLLRAHARRTNRRLAELAGAVIDGSATTEVLGTKSPNPPANTRVIPKDHRRHGSPRPKPSDQRSER
jgi:transcriptional regulator with GAF, ATPase, and Fis domain